MLARTFVLSLMIVSLALSGCNFKRPRPIAKEKPTPGIFTGKSGSFVIYQEKSRKRK